MPFDHERLRDWPIPAREQTIRDSDTILYALAIGMGGRPAESPFVYERALRMVPSMVTALAHPGPWLADPATGVDYARVMHGEEAFRIRAPLPPTGVFRSRSRVTGVFDRGPGKGAFVHVRRKIVEAGSGAVVAETASVIACRGDGGCGGPSPGPTPPWAAQGPPDAMREVATLPQQALLYRLCGDRNPLHADPAVAAAQGFARPILHGLCSFGIACAALMDMLCPGEPDRLRAMGARFTAPVLPGETLRVEAWRQGARALFRVAAVERGAVVLDRGRAEIAPAGAEWPSPPPGADEREDD